MVSLIKPFCIFNLVIVCLLSYNLYHKVIRTLPDIATLVAQVVTLWILLQVAKEQSDQPKQADKLAMINEKVSAALISLEEIIADARRNNDRLNSYSDIVTKTASELFKLTSKVKANSQEITRLQNLFRQLQNDVKAELQSIMKTGEATGTNNCLNRH